MARPRATLEIQFSTQAKALLYKGGRPALQVGVTRDGEKDKACSEDASPSKRNPVPPDELQLGAEDVYYKVRQSRVQDTAQEVMV